MDILSERIVWLDLESTGLNPWAGDKLLQVAALITDGNLEEVADPFMVKVHYSEAEVEAMRAAAVPFVQQMHDSNGLWSSLPTGGLPLPEAEGKLLEYLNGNLPEDYKPRLGGNSITLDRNFLLAFMPTALERLHYRSLDMSSIVGFFELFRPEVPLFEKAKSHDALDDIRESLAEARHYRRYLDL